MSDTQTNYLKIIPSMLHVDPEWSAQDVEALADEIYSSFIEPNESAVLWISRNEPTPDQIEAFSELDEGSIILSGELSLMVALIDVIKCNSARKIYTATTALVQSSKTLPDGSIQTTRVFNHVSYREIG